MITIVSAEKKYTREKSHHPLPLLSCYGPRHFTPTAYRPVASGRERIENGAKQEEKKNNPYLLFVYATARQETGTVGQPNEENNERKWVLLLLLLEIIRMRALQIKLSS